MMVKRKYVALAMALSGLFSASTVVAREMPPIITFESELATVFGSEGILKLSILGFYIGNEIEPEYYLVFESTNRCSESEQSRECHQTISSYGYESVSELISALDAGIRALEQRQKVSTTFKLCKLRCNGVPTSTLAVEPSSSVVKLTVAQTSITTYSVSLDRDNSRTLLDALKFSERLQKHLAPQFEAFNAAKPDQSAELSLERL